MFEFCMLAHSDIRNTQRRASDLWHIFSTFHAFSSFYERKFKVFQRLFAHQREYQALMDHWWPCPQEAAVLDLTVSGEIRTLETQTEVLIVLLVLLLFPVHFLFFYFYHTFSQQPEVKQLPEGWISVQGRFWNSNNRTWWQLTSRPPCSFSQNKDGWQRQQIWPAFCPSTPIQSDTIKYCHPPNKWLKWWNCAHAFYCRLSLISRDA